MKLILYILLAVEHCALAAKYAFDPSCAALTIRDGTVLDLRLHIQNAMHEALDMAETAHEAMTRFSGDGEVRRICDLYLGDSDVNRLSAQATFASLLIFEKDPSVLAANNDQWRAQRTSADVEFYASMERMVKVPDKLIYRDTAMDGSLYMASEIRGLDDFYSLTYDLSENVKRTNARTTDSDLFKKADFVWRKDKTLSRKDPQFSTPRQYLASQIDLAPWYMDQLNQDHWPSLTRERVEIVAGHEFVENYLAGSRDGLPRAPVDALRNFGLLLLHELTHTVQGGYLEDLPDKNSCYGFYCIVRNKDPRNSDTIALLGQTLKLWKMGYLVNDQGHIRNIS